MTLFWHQTGPLMRYADKTLEISDLNPELHTKWRMTRTEMLGLGFRCIIAAIFR
jgi:hypothetical protein